MKKILFILLLFLSVPALRAQAPYAPFEQIRHYTETQSPSKEDSAINYLTNFIRGGIHYLYPLYQAIGWEDKFRKKYGDKGFYDNLSQMLAFTGDARMADYYSQKSFDTLNDDAAGFIQQRVQQLGNLQTIDAAAYIAGKALDAQVVMINEAHNKPVHRAFTYSLLDQLYKEGFRYLAMEMLDNYPGHSLDRLNSKTGFYATEPVAGELIRKAIDLGYTLISYEDTIISGHTATQRDSAQAAHLFEVIKLDPKAKILVHAGYGHIAEMANADDYIPMALAFKTISGIDPLTIDQAVMTEGSINEYGRIYYQTLTNYLDIEEPIIFLRNKEPVSLTGLNGYDLSVVHPPTVFKNNRPLWLSLNGDRKETAVSPQEKNLFLLQAYYRDEYELGPLEQIVPADQTYISSDFGYYSLYLKPGKYKLVFRDVAYKTLSVRDKEVE